MRSLNRPEWPKYKNGKLRNYKNYSSFLKYLFKYFGRYCCYCEIRARSLDVEHISPKSLNSTYICNWFNLLIACPTCNRDYKKIKMHREEDLSGLMIVIHLICLCITMTAL